MLIAFNLVLLGNVTAVFMGVSAEVDLQSIVSIFVNICAIFAKYIVFAISFIIINVLLIKNKLKIAIGFFAVVIALVTVVGILQIVEYNHLEAKVNATYEEYGYIALES